MKKRIMAIALCAVMIIGAVVVSASAWDFRLPVFAQKQAPTPKVEEYPLWVNGIQVTSANAKDIPFDKPQYRSTEALEASASFGAGPTDPRFAPKQGKVSFDARTNTLTLDGVSIENSNREDCVWYEDDSPEFDTFTIRVLHNSTLEMVYPTDDQCGAIWSEAEHTVIEIAPGQSLLTKGTTSFEDNATVRGGTWYAYNSCEFVNESASTAAIDVWGTLAVRDAVVYGYSQNAELWDPYYQAYYENVDNDYSNYAAIDVDNLAVDNSLVYGVIEKPVGAFYDDWCYAYTDPEKDWYYDNPEFDSAPEFADPYEYDWATGINVYKTISGEPFTISGSRDVVPFFDAFAAEPEANWQELWYAPGSPFVEESGYRSNGSFWFDLDEDSESDYDWAPASTVCIMSDSFCGEYQYANEPTPYGVFDMFPQRFALGEGNSLNRKVGTFEFIPAVQGSWMIKAVFDPDVQLDYTMVSLADAASLNAHLSLELYLNAYFTEDGVGYLYYDTTPYIWNIRNGSVFATDTRITPVDEYQFVTMSAGVKDTINGLIGTINRLSDKVSDFIVKPIVTALNKILAGLGVPPIQPKPKEGLKLLEEYYEDGVRKYGFFIGTFTERVSTDYYIADLPSEQELGGVWAQLTTRKTSVKFGKLVQAAGHQFGNAISYPTDFDMATGDYTNVHEYVCLRCGQTVIEACRYNPITNRCAVCGSIDPASNAIQGVTVTFDNSVSPNLRVIVSASSKSPVRSIEYLVPDSELPEGEFIDFSGLPFVPAQVRGNAIGFITTEMPEELVIRVTDASGRVWFFDWRFPYHADARLIEVLPAEPVPGRK